MSKVRDILLHIVICAAGVCLLLIFPPLKTGYLQAYVTGQSIDSIASATTTLAQPTGNYSIYINKEVHDEESLETWTTFFTDYANFTFSMENIACAVARGDQGAIGMASSFQSQLPENQMQLTIENPTVLLSRMAYGKYDMVILSEEFIESYGNVDGGKDCLILKVSGTGPSDDAGEAGTDVSLDASGSLQNETGGIG